MGSKLHQINRLFTTLKRNNCNVVTVGLKTSDAKTASANITLKTSILSDLNQLKAPMDGLVECHDRDSVRNTMLKHDEIFRRQVQELHRLYRVQKVLMTEVGKNKITAAMAEARTRIWSNTASTSDTSHSSQVSSAHPRAGMSSRELSICSRDRSNVHVRGFDLEQHTSKVGEMRAMEEERAPAVHGKQLNREAGISEVPLSWSDDGSEIELTLSIGCGPNKKKRTHSLHPNVDIGCSDSFPSDTRPLLSSRSVRQEKGEECVDSSAGLDRESLKSPPCLLQALNLNKI